jgi:hypothetical protein
MVFINRSLNFILQFLIFMADICWASKSKSKSHQEEPRRGAGPGHGGAPRRGGGGGDGPPPAVGGGSRAGRQGGGARVRF